MPPRFDGPKMRAHRRGANLSLAEFADAIEQAAGRRWHHGTLYNIEIAKAEPGLKLSHAIAKVLDLPWDQLWIDDSAQDAAAQKTGSRS